MIKTKEMRHIGVNTKHRAIYAIVSLALFATAGCARLSPRSGYLIDETARRVDISRRRDNTMTENFSSTNQVRDRKGWNTVRRQMCACPTRGVNREAKLHECLGKLNNTNFVVHRDQCVFHDNSFQSSVVHF